MDKQAVEKPTQCEVSRRVPFLTSMSTSRRYYCTPLFLFRLSLPPLRLCSSAITQGWKEFCLQAHSAHHEQCTDFSPVCVQNQDRNFVLKVSALEIYNEVVKDLLTSDTNPLRLLDDKDVISLSLSSTLLTNFFSKTL